MRVGYDDQRSWGASPGQLLTPREREVLHLVAQLMTNQQIAKRLGLSVYTVKNHVHRILEKTGAKNRMQAADMVEGRIVGVERKKD